MKEKVLRSPGPLDPLDLVDLVDLVSPDLDVEAKLDQSQKVRIVS